MPKCDWPAPNRNRGPILEVLREWLPGPARVLEIGSGTGQHAAFFARALPDLDWQPSEVDVDLFESIVAWSDESRAAGKAAPRPPISLDVTGDAWPAGPFDAVFSCNLIHIAPWDACLGLLRGAAGCLRPGGLLILYGPFRIGGRHTAPSNRAFDEDLRRQDARWGVRDLEVVEAAAAERGLAFVRSHELPANNQVAVFRKRSPDR